MHPYSMYFVDKPDIHPFPAMPVLVFVCAGISEPPAELPHLQILLRCGGLLVGLGLTKALPFDPKSYY
jgi:hypothetical protein